MSIDLWCNDCGRELEVSVGFQKVSVFPCERCAKDARDTGHTEGFESGQESRDDEIASLQSDLRNMVEQNRILQEELDSINESARTEPD